MKDIDMFMGPRIPNEMLQRERKRFLLPTVIFGTSALLLLMSIFLPYWKLTLHAPQYPSGLSLHVYVNQVAGDVQEIDELNHYIGMRSMKDGATLERTLSIVIIGALALLAIAAIYIHSPVVVFFSLPTFFYPAIFLGDLYFWLWNFGTNLDPHAPLSNAVKPFVPPLLGTGMVGQFKTVATWEIGLYFSLIAAILVPVALYYHRKAYKPLLMEQIRQQAGKD